MIIYIHGFGSCALGVKAKLFKEEFQDDILIPSLSYVPLLAIHTLEQLIETFLNLNKNEKVSLIGSSLGGYYCLYLAHKYNLKAVLINPAIRPFKTLDKIGFCRNYFDDSSFEITQEHLDFLKFIEIKKQNNEDNFLLLLQKGDETLDYKEALELLPKATLFLEEGGNHSFENIKNHFVNIKSFLKP